MIKTIQCILLFPVIAFSAAFGQETITLRTHTEFIDVSDYASDLVDTNKALDVKSVWAGSYDNQFVYTPGTKRYGQIGSNHYLRFNIKSNVSRSFYLEAYSGSQDTIQVFFTSEGKLISSFLTGANLPFSTKNLGHKNFVFPVPKSDEIVTVYVRSSSEHKDGLRMVIKSDTYFIEYSNSEYLLLGLFYGILLLVCIQNIFLLIKSKSAVHIYYILYVLSFAMFTVSTNGLGFQYLWPSAPGLNDVARHVALVLFEGFLLLYISSILNIRNNYPRYYRFIAPLIGFRVLLLVVYYVFPIAILDSGIFDVLLFIFAFYLAGVAYQKEKGYVRNILIGFFALSIGFIIHVLRINAVIPTDLGVFTIFIVYIFNIASIIEVLFFSLAITERIKELNENLVSSQEQIILQLKEKEELTQKVNKELEQKVQERTTELNTANERLNEIVEQVNAMNINLDLTNRDLQKQGQAKTKARVLLKEASFQDFKIAFPDKISCLKFLDKKKWTGREYNCKKCGNTKYNEGTSFLSRRCSKCNYDESCTNGTLYERLRMDLPLAFYITYLLYRTNGSMTIDQLQEKTGLDRTSVWRFKKRVMDRMNHKKFKAAKATEDGWDEIILN